MLGHIATVSARATRRPRSSAIGMGALKAPADAPERPIELASAPRWPTAAAMAGRFFDEWQVGDRVSHALTRTVTETDNVLITTLTHNPQPLHLDYEAAAADRIRQAAGQQLLHLQPAGRRQRPRHHARHARRQSRLRQGAACPTRFSPATRCAAKASASTLRESKSRPNAGIVTWAHRAFNQRGELVCEMTRTALIQKKPQ